jgi:hypothetical protein
MNHLPVKNPQSLSIFEEIFLPGDPKSVEKHLKDLSAGKVGEIYDRFVWPKPSTNKKNKIGDLLDLFNSWQSEISETVEIIDPEEGEQVTIASVLPMMEREITVALVDSKQAAETKLAQVKEIDFSQVKNEDHFKTLVAHLDDLKELSGTPDKIRLDAIKPITQMTKGIQQLLKKWREPFDLEINSANADLKSWSKEHIKTRENIVAKYEAKVEILNSMKKESEIFLQIAEQMKLYKTDALIDGFLEQFQKNKATIPGLIRDELSAEDLAERFAVWFEREIKTIETFAQIHKSKIEAKTMPELASLESENSNLLEYLKEKIIELHSELNGVIRGHEETIKANKPKTQLGLRRVLKVELELMDVNPGSQFAIEPEILNDPKVIEAITKVAAARLKDKGVKPGDDLKAYSEKCISDGGFGQSLVIYWDLV